MFPIPREALNLKTRGRKYELLGKNDHQDIALHHLIRKPGNKLSKKIHAFDNLFERNRKTPENVSNEQIEEYQKLVADASMHEIKKYEVRDLSVFISWRCVENMILDLH